ncbi:MAG: phosphotransferase family protein, partial [Actinomycetota bacterium]|nr:phosphotransferase family protein [Actinomycetota bacterium]
AALRDAGELGAGDRVERLEQLLGGWSRHSFRAEAVTASGAARRYVVRVKPPGALLDTDLALEFRVHQALQPEDIATPCVYHLDESDDTPFGGPFFVMDHIEGRAPNMFKADERAWLEEDWRGRRGIAEDMVVNLAGIHTLPRERQPAIVPQLNFADVVERWRAVYEDKRLVRDPVIEEAYDWLGEQTPEGTRDGLVHGDYRVGNTLIADARVRAILDWELTYRGDVRFDLGYLVLDRMAGKHLRTRGPLMGSFAEEGWFLDRYAQLTGEPVDRASLRPFEMLAIMMLLATQITAVWMYKHGHTADFRMAWSRYSFAGLRQDMVRLMRW